jgi:hypothetical protein
MPLANFSSSEKFLSLLTGHAWYPISANFRVIADPVDTPAPIMMAENFE